MNIEKEVFKKVRLDIKNLISYGFTKRKDVYTYSKVFMNNFRADIEISEQGVVKGKVLDLDFGEEYINLRIDSQMGKFVHRIREEYINILEDIKEHCFETFYFITNQANRITKLIDNMYHDQPVFPWKKFEGYGVFKNSINKKWYALIINIDKNKIDKKESEEVEIINLKLDNKKISKLLNKKGFYPAYHMNKKNWITIILNDTISDEEIIEYVRESHAYTEKNK